MKQSLKIGFAGANPQRGWARDAHLGALRATAGFEVHSVLSRNAEIAAESQVVFGSKFGFSDLAAFLADPELDVVAVTVKVPEHRAIVLAALAAGKHVYCEWPLGRDLAETEEMAAAARVAGVHVAIGVQGAHAPAVRHAAQLVRDGAIGRPMNLRVVSPTAGWARKTPPVHAYLQDKSTGATLSSIAGGHTLAAIEAVVGPYAGLSAVTSILWDKIRISGTDQQVERSCADHVLAIGRHANGCVSSLEIVGGEPEMGLVFELRGSEGKLTITGGGPGGYQTGDLKVTTAPASEPQPLPIVAGITDHRLNMAEAWGAFRADIVNGTRLVPDFDTAVRLTTLLEAIDTASATRQHIMLGE